MATPSRKRSQKRSPKRRRKPSRMLSWWLLWRVPILALIVMAGWWYGIRPIAAEQGWVRVDMPLPICGAASRGAPGCIADGDTIIIGFGGDRRRIRLTGFDTPELDGACAAERETAITARTALRDWLARGPFEWDGANGPPYDQYGRELRAVRRARPDGTHELLADTMIARGLAGGSSWGEAPVDWCQ